VPDPSADFEIAVDDADRLPVAPSAARIQITLPDRRAPVPQRFVGGTPAWRQGRPDKDNSAHRFACARARGPGDNSGGAGPIPARHHEADDRHREFRPGQVDRDCARDPGSGEPGQGPAQIACQIVGGKARYVAESDGPASRASASSNASPMSPPGASLYSEGERSSRTPAM